MGSQLAVGATAEVFAWGDRHVLKLFRHGIPATVAEREAAQARLAHAAGLPTPAVGDVVAVEGRAGIVFERTDGPTMLQRLSDAPGSAEGLAGQLAALHADLHAHAAPRLPAQRERLRLNIGRAQGLSERLKARAAQALDALPDGEALCHGDFHPGNVIMTVGNPVVIDWLDATRGNPLADLARTALLVRHAELPAHVYAPAVQQAVRGLRVAFLEAYLRRYASHRPVDSGQLAAWALPVAAARLAEPVGPGEREELVTAVEASAGRG
jgi:aminoglycoside phosphotransferase (APT) family kinase protein